MNNSQKGGRFNKSGSVEVVYGTVKANQNKILPTRIFALTVIPTMAINPSENERSLRPEQKWFCGDGPSGRHSRHQSSVDNTVVEK